MNSLSLDLLGLVVLATNNYRMAIMCAKVCDRWAQAVRRVQAQIDELRTICRCSRQSELGSLYCEYHKNLQAIAATGENVDLLFLLLDKTTGTKYVRYKDRYYYTKIIPQYDMTTMRLYDFNSKENLNQQYYYHMLRSKDKITGTFKQVGVKEYVQFKICGKTSFEDYYWSSDSD